MKERQGTMKQKMNKESKERLLSISLFFTSAYVVLRSFPMRLSFSYVHSFRQSTSKRRKNGEP